MQIERDYMKHPEGRVRPWAKVALLFAAVIGVIALISILDLWLWVFILGVVVGLSWPGYQQAVIRDDAYHRARRRRRF